jgi:hypothetical protein
MSLKGAPARTRPGARKTSGNPAAPNAAWSAPAGAPGRGAPAGAPGRGTPRRGNSSRAGPRQRARATDNRFEPLERVPTEEKLDAENDEDLLHTRVPPSGAPPKKIQKPACSPGPKRKTSSASSSPKSFSRKSSSPAKRKSPSAPSAKGAHQAIPPRDPSKKGPAFRPSLSGTPAASFPLSSFPKRRLQVSSQARGTSGGDQNDPTPRTSSDAKATLFSLPKEDYFGNVATEQNRKGAHVSSELSLSHQGQKGRKTLSIPPLVVENPLPVLVHPVPPVGLCPGVGFALRPNPGAFKQTGLQQNHPRAH